MEDIEKAIKLYEKTTYSKQHPVCLKGSKIRITNTEPGASLNIGDIVEISDFKCNVDIDGDNIKPSARFCGRLLGSNSSNDWYSGYEWELFNCDVAVSRLLNDIDQYKLRLQKDYEHWIKMKEKEYNDSIIIQKIEDSRQDIVTSIDSLINKMNNSNGNQIECLEKRLDNIERYSIIAAKTMITIEEAAIITGLSKSWLYKATCNHTIPYYKPNGKTIYFDRGELDSWMKQNRIATKDEIERIADDYIRNNSQPNGWPKKKRKK